MTAGALRTPLALAVDALWGFAAVAVTVQLFGQGDGPAPSIFSVGAVVVLSLLLARVLQSGDEASDVRMIGLVGSMLALTVIGVLTYNGTPWDFGWLVDLLSHPATAIEPNGHVIAGMAAMTALWVRGARQGSLPDLDFEGVLFSVSLGFAAVVIAALTTPDAQSDVSWGALAFAFSIVALMTLAVFNAPSRTALSSMMRGWPLAIGVLACAALVFALVAGTVDRDAFDVLSPVVAPVEAGGRLLRDYVLAPIFWVIALPFRLFAWVLGLFVPDAQEMLERPRDRPIEEPPEDDEESPLWWRALVILGLSGGGAFIALIVLLLLWQSFRRYARRPDTDPREEREGIEPASLGADLASMLGALGRRFRRGDAPNAVAIRRLYFDVLSEAEVRGLARPPAITPSQFASRLDAHFGSPAPSEISSAFIESRYAERTIEDERVRALRAQWEADRAQ